MSELRDKIAALLHKEITGMDSPCSLCQDLADKVMDIISDTHISLDAEVKGRNEPSEFSTCRTSEDQWNNPYR